MVLIPPSPEIRERIMKSFNEDVTTRDRDLEAIKEWLRKEPHLPDTWDEHRILIFLRGCKFSLEKCKRKLDMYFTMRTAIPEFFTNRDIDRPELREIFKHARGAVLPRLTAEGRRVCITGALHTDFDALDVVNLAKVVFMMADIRLGIEEVGSSGDIYVFDASIALPKHFVKISPTVVKKFVMCVHEAYPAKVKEIHVINSTPFVDFLIKWARPFLKEKIRNRIRIHPDVESLHKFVPKEMLPEEYGGTGGRLEDFMAQWLEKLREYRPWFEEQEKIKADESKRPGKPKNHEELFGLEGSFKQLNID